MKVLIIKIADLITTACSTAVARAIKQQFPDATVHFVCGKTVIDCLRQEKTIDQIFELQADITPTVLLLLKEKYSHCIDLQSDGRSFFIKTYLGHQYNSVLVKHSYPKGFLNILFGKQKAFSHEQLSTQMIQSIPWLKQGFDGNVWPYLVDESFDLKKDDLPMSHKAGYYTLNIDDNNKLELYKEIVSKINFPVVLLSTQTINENSGVLKAIDAFKIYDAVGKFKTEEQFNILRDSNLNIIGSNFLGYQAVASKQPLLQLTGKRLPIGDMKSYANINTFISDRASSDEIINRVSGFLFKN